MKFLTRLVLQKPALEELQATSDRMKKRLENMGEVNPTAIEAFMEMKKRYEFILEQKNDSGFSKRKPSYKQYRK